MAAHVIDASVIVASLVEEDGTTKAERAMETLVAEGDQLHAPDLIAYEVANALRKRVARGDLDSELALQRMSEFGGLEIDLHPSPAIARAALGLALSHDLTAYDAAYLAVALTLGAPLLTLDQALRDRCAAVGVSTFPL